MSGWLNRARVATGVGVLLTACLLAPSLAPARAFAEPASPAGEVSTETIESKKAEKAAAVAELERMRQELAVEMAEYVSMGRQISQTEADIAEVTAQIEEQSGSLMSARRALSARVIELYRGDRLVIVQLLFTADSIPDLIDRMSYLTAASRHDAHLIQSVREEQQESLYLQETLARRIEQLQSLQVDADERRQRIEAEIDAQQARAIELGEDIARMMREAAAVQIPGNPDASFAPDTIISQERFRAVNTMSVMDIQAFLEKQPGRLASLRVADYQGQVKSAAQMIAEASAAWNVNPEVILATLQKEQSLLSRSAPTQNALDWAMGCGKTDSATLNQYRGFGNQIWYGAKSLDANAKRWKPGAELNIDGSVVMPTNSATFALYRYTPHLHGNTSFWLIFWRYFGDPLAA